MVLHSESSSTPPNPPFNQVASNQVPGTISLVVTIISADGLPSHGAWKRKPSAFVQLTAGNFPPRETSVVERSIAPSWGAAFSFIGLDTSSELRFKVLHKSLGRNINLGHVVIKVRDLLEVQKGRENAILQLPVGSLMIHARQETGSSATAEALAQAKQGSDQIVTLTVLDIPDSGSTDVYQSLGTVVDSLEKLMGVADSFAQIHPYVNAAWQTVSSLYKVIQRQLDRDRKIFGLVGTMETLYSFVYHLEFLNDRHNSLETIVQQILKQTVECALFIQEYAGHGFAGKAIRHSLSTTDSKIEEFQGTFMELQKSLDTGLEVQISLVSFRTYEKIEKLVMRNTLEPVTMNWSNHPLCQPDTRLDIIKFITHWVSNASSDRSNVLWLWGLAGSGKSTLSTTIANLFNDVNRLGAFVFFDRNVKERSDPSTVIQTLAYQLGSFDSRIGRVISAAIDQNAQIANMQLSAQFRELIKAPLKSVAELPEGGPIVIVIDALEECGTESSRENLLTLLAKETAYLPQCIRIIITSRADRDINFAFRRQPHIHTLELETSPDNVDISTFIRHRMAKIAEKNSLAEDWPGPEKVSALVKRTAGLFIWASTACNYIDGYNPTKRLDELDAGNVYQNAEAALDALYVKALESSGYWDDAGFRNDCCAILGLILTAKHPLSPYAIDRLLTLDLGSQRVISTLRSVVHFQEPNDPVRILHLSFRDFLSDRSRCKDGPWFIDLVDHNQRLATYCITCLNVAFEGEFCQLALDEQDTSQNLDEEVMYACTFWIAHVCEMGACTDSFASVLWEFLSKNALHWLEAMSILGISRGTASTLEKLYNWVTVLVPGHADLHELTYDIYRFAVFFSITIAEHPSLVYLSALPFTPVNSKIYQLFYHEGLPTVLGGFQQWWSPSLRILQSGDVAKTVYSLAFSPDGLKIVSSDLGNIRIWDVTMGTESIPALSTDGDINFVTFSPDGSKIWSATDKGTIWIVDTETGAEVGPVLKWEQWALDSTVPREFHRVAFSPDGLRVALGSRDGTFHMVNIAASREAYPALEDAPSEDSYRMVRSIDFSPDGTRVASGSGDGTVHIRDAKTGKSAIPKLQAHSRNVTAVKFSPCGCRVISCSEDGTIHTWNSITGEAEKISLPELSGVLEPSAAFRPLVFSVDGSKMASTSSVDDTIQIWDVKAGKRVGSPLQGHWAMASSVAFSPDGARLVSGAYSDMIRIWDITPGKQSNTKMQRHSQLPKEIKFSPDGLAIISTAHDGIRYCDTITGRELKSKEGSEYAHDELDETIMPVDVETGTEVGPRPEHSRWLSSLSSTSQESTILSCPDDYENPSGKVWVDGMIVWRLPLELTYMCGAVRGRFIAIGITSGQIFTVHLPLEGLSSPQ